ncbi:MAG TPA: hypothetical protein VHC67_03625 [Gaiellaceae bacterium]|nr:hypothetical protein [Gaiellaceae bacterium]
MSPLRRIVITSRWAALALVLSAPIALVPYVLQPPGLDGAIGLPGLKGFAGAVRAALPSAPARKPLVVKHTVTPPARHRPAANRPAAAHRTGTATPSGRHLQSVVTASCDGCTVVKDRSSGALRATVSPAGRQPGSAYAVVDMGTKSATLAVSDRLALGAGQVPSHPVDVLQVTDARNRVVYRLVVAAHSRLLSFVSPPGALSAQGISESTGRRVPNDGRTELNVRVVTQTNGFVTVGVDGDTVLARTGLQGGAAGQQRYVAAGILHASQAGAGLTVIHDSLSVQGTTQSGAEQPVVVSAAALPIASQPAPPPPANLSVPTVSGTPYDGSKLTVQTGTWSGADSLAVRWSRCAADGTACNTIAGAVDTTYAPDTDDVGSVLRATVTATNAQGTAPATSALTAVVAGASPVDLTPPTIAGTAIQGGTLRFVAGTWRWKNGSSTYKWQRCDATGSNCGPVDLPVTAPYLLTAADVGSTFRLVVTAPGFVGTTTVTSAATAVVVPSVPVSSAAPAVGGSAVVGSTLTASAGAWSQPQPALTYAWSRCAADGTACAPIDGATGSTYAVGAADVGSTIVVSVTGSNITGAATAASTPTAVVPAPPSATAAPSIAGDLFSGSTLTANLGTWSDSAATLTVAWLRCDASGACAPIDGAVAGTYALTDADVGSTIEIVVTAVGPTGTGSTTSAATAAVGPTPPPPPPPPPPAPGIVTPPAIAGDATVGSTLTADPGTWSDPAAALGLQWERCDATATTCTPIDGATGSTYTVATEDLGSTLELAVTATNAGGSGGATSAPTAVVAAPPEPSTDEPETTDSAPATDVPTPDASAPAADSASTP